VLAVVYFAAFVALGFSGYAAGADKRRARAPTHVLGALIELIIVIIQDLDRPGRGLVNVDQTPLTDAAAQVDRTARAISN